MVDLVENTFDTLERSNCINRTEGTFEGDWLVEATPLGKIAACHDIGYKTIGK